MSSKNNTTDSHSAKPETIISIQRGTERSSPSSRSRMVCRGLAPTCSRRSASSEAEDRHRGTTVQATAITVTVVITATVVITPPRHDDHARLVVAPKRDL